MLVAALKKAIRKAGPGAPGDRVYHSRPPPPWPSQSGVKIGHAARKPAL